jgi:hypothetical protein
MDSQAHPAAKDIQETQNSAVLALMRSLAALIGQLKNLQLTSDDLILMSGSSQAWPKNNANIDLVAKINDIFLNTDNKASVRIFIEDADGKRTQIFRQVKGVIPPKGDPLNLAESMRAMLTQQNLATFGKEPPQSKVVIETDSSVAVNSFEVAPEPEKTQMIGEEVASATPLSDDRMAESNTELRANDSPLVEVNMPESSVMNALPVPAERSKIDVATAIPLTDDQINQTIAELRLKHMPVTGIEIPENLGLSLADGLTPEQAVSMGDTKLKFSFIRADGLRLQLNEYYRRSNVQGYEYLKTDPKMKDEVKLDELESSFALAVATVEQRLTALQRDGRWMPANQLISSVPAQADEPTLVRDYAPGLSTMDDIMGQSAPSVQEQNEAFFLKSFSNQIPSSETNYQALVENEQSIVSFNDPIHALHEKVRAGGLSVVERSDLTQIDPHNQYVALATLQRIETPDLDNRMIDYGIATLAHDAGLQMPEIQKMLTARDELVRMDTDFYEHTADVLSTVDPIWIPESPSIEEVDKLAADQTNMLGSDKQSRAVQSFVSEVSALSAQIESVRAEANVTLSAVKTFALDMQQRINEPAMKAWAATQISEVAAQSVSIRDRLKSAGAGLVDTLKQRAATDWQVVKETVAAKTAEGWERHGGATSSAWVDVQRASIGSSEIDRAIATVIDHLGDRQGASGMAKLDGYQFAVHNGQTAIFNSKNEPIYKDGLLTGKQTTSDTAYLVAFPNHVEQAAKASEALQASHRTTPSQQASAPARKR